MIFFRKELKFTQYETIENNYRYKDPLVMAVLTDTAENVEFYHFITGLSMESIKLSQ